MPSPSPIDAVVFDLDGTLAMHDQDPADVLKTTFAETGVEPFCDAEDFLDAAMDVPDADSDRDFFDRAFTIAAERHHGPLERTTELAATYDGTVDHTRVSFRDGAERALDLAATVGPVGLVTNGEEATQGTKLDALGIADRFDVTVFAGEQTPPKPDPEPFHRVVEELDVSRDGTYYVGNSLQHDVVGAKGVGLGAGWFPTEYDADESPSTYAHQPDHTFVTLRDLETVLNGST